MYETADLTVRTPNRPKSRLRKRVPFILFVSGIAIRTVRSVPRRVPGAAHPRGVLPPSGTVRGNPRSLQWVFVVGKREWEREEAQTKWTRTIENNTVPSGNREQEDKFWKKAELRDWP